MKISRALNGIEMNLVGTRELSGHLEIYLDTKECADHRDNDATCWRFDLNADGTIGGTHFAGGAFVTAGLEYDLYSNGTNGYEARFFIPYEYLDITPLEVFGISLGQWSDSASDWDGLGLFRAIRGARNAEDLHSSQRDKRIVPSGKQHFHGQFIRQCGNGRRPHCGGRIFHDDGHERRMVYESSRRARIRWKSSIPAKVSHKDDGNPRRLFRYALFLV